MINDSDLTKKQAEILRLILEEYLTQRKIAQRLKISRQAVEKTVKILRQKGYLKRHYQKGIKGGVGVGQTTLFKGGDQKKGKKTPLFPVEKLMRGHNFQLDVGILKGSEHYERMREKCNVLHFGDETVMLYAGKICIFSNRSFFGKTGAECAQKALEALLVVVQRLEFSLKLDLEKDWKQNKKLVRCHIAEVDSEVALNCEQHKKRLRVRGKDGLVWALTDASKGNLELETVHPVEAVQDMDDALSPFLNDIRDLAKQGKLPLISELLMVQGVQAAQGLKTSKDLNILINFLKDKL